MLKEISLHLRDLFFIKQILHGLGEWVVTRNLDNIYTSAYVKNLRKHKLNAPIAGRHLKEVCNNKVSEYYIHCGLTAIDTDRYFVSPTIYSPAGKITEGLLYYYPHKDDNNNIIGCISYNIDLKLLRKSSHSLFNNNFDNLYNNLFAYKELFNEVKKIINKISITNLNNNNINLIDQLKMYLNILLDNLQNIYKQLYNTTII